MEGAAAEESLKLYAVSKKLARGEPSGLKYSPDQPRDETGKWSSGGGGSSEHGSLGESPVSDHAASVLDQWTTPARGSRSGEYEKIRKAGEAWVNGADNKGFDHLYAETQSRLKDAGIKEITAYRGMELAHDHPLAQAISSGKLKSGQEISANGMTLTSWSESKGVAAHFADSPTARAARNSGDSKTIGIVVQRVAEAKDVVSGERIHSGFLNGEKELILKNSGSSKLKIVGIYGA